MTLSPQAYTDPGLYELEVETIFNRECLLIGRAHGYDRSASAGKFDGFGALPHH